MAPHAPPPKAESYHTLLLCPRAAEPPAETASNPVSARPRGAPAVAAIKRQAVIATTATHRPPSEPGAARTTRPARTFRSQDERAADEDTIVDAGLAERIATELAREQALAPPSARPVAPQALAPRLGKYRLLRLLASGQTSLVHLARSEAPADRARHLAIRSLRREHGRDAPRALAFIENARLFSALRHDNLARVLDAGVDAGTPYVVMDYLHGRSLRSALQQRPGGLPLDFAVTAIAGCAQALHHARSGQAHHGARHLGVAPSYVMACADGAIKLFRLGLTGFPSPTLARGELAYLAPELARGDGCDARSDVFSLGVMLYELITGVHPYLDPTAPASPTDRDRLLHARIEPPTRYLPHLASELADVVMTAMARPPDGRYPDCQEFGRTLLGVAERVAVRTGPAAVRQLVNRLLGNGSAATRTADGNEVTSVRVRASSEDITGVRRAVSGPDPASATPSDTKRQPTSPPAPKPPQQPPPIASPLPTTPQMRPANKPGGSHVAVAAPRGAQPPAAAPLSRPPERAPHRAFQAVVLLCGATVAVAGVALAVSSSTQPLTTAEPTVSARAPSDARATAPRPDEAPDEVPPAHQTSDQAAEPPSAPIADEAQAPSNTLVYEYPTPDPPVYQPPDPPEDTPSDPQAEEPSSPPPQEPPAAEPSQPLDSPQEDLSAYQPPQEPAAPSPQEP